MKYLLDTHVLIWCLRDDPTLSLYVKSILQNKANIVYVSSVSIAECCIKASIGKLNHFPNHFDQYIEEIQFEILPFTASHALVIQQFTKHHRDPFDWMLIAQSITENCMLVTRDREIHKYEINILEV